MTTLLEPPTILAIGKPPFSGDGGDMEKPPDESDETAATEAEEELEEEI